MRSARALRAVRRALRFRRRGGGFARDLSSSQARPDKTSLREPLGPYEPQKIESYWYEWWESQGYFAAGAGNKEGAGKRDSFSMVLPPPNVTGTLHIGHALTCTLQDVLARYHRMDGKDTVWIPGLDHAGIATQSVVERRLERERGMTRHDLGRDALVDEIWKWKEEHGGTINTQLRRMGSSLDWSREVFTLDDAASEAVTEAFIMLHEQGLIYRSTRLVNWCPRLKTALSDIETEPLDLEGPTAIRIPGLDRKVQFGRIDKFAYGIEGLSDEELVVATTRPETLFGDTAVAVHPDDPRFTHLHGRLAIQPLTGRRVPIVTDSELVDMEKGTGAVKVTPAHDENDFACGRRLGLEFLDIMDDQGNLTDMAGEFSGQNRLAARKGVIRALEQCGAYRGFDAHPMRVSMCSRSGDAIEPRVKPQWFVDCQGMATSALRQRRDGRVRIVPESPHAKTWDSWLSHPVDWCVSRQLWWGHRIPAYAVVPAQQDEEKPTDERWVVARSTDEARARAMAEYGLREGEFDLVQDPDVLDTWFSSGLFPLVCFGWPRRDPRETQHYPLSVLETGSDILFFWVARMAMLCENLMGSNAPAPFDTVVLHPMVRDAQGRKMSKSLGNVVDPVDLIQGRSLESLVGALGHGNVTDPKELKIAEKSLKKDFPQGIPECGTDGLRFGLCAYMQQGDKINLDIHRMQHYRFFCNKIWQACSFVLSNQALYSEQWGSESNCDVPFHDAQGLGGVELGLPERWALRRLQNAVTATRASIEASAFGTAATGLQSFFVGDLCDVYLEFAKPSLRSSDRRRAEATLRTLSVCMETSLRLLHPMMPYLTEELWQRLVGDSPGRYATIMVTPYPTPEAANTVAVGSQDDEKSMDVVLSVLRAIRGAQAEFRTRLSKEEDTDFKVLVEGEREAKCIEANLEAIKAQVKRGVVRVGREDMSETRGSGRLFRPAGSGIVVAFSLASYEGLDRDVAAANKKLDKLSKAEQKLLKVTSAASYREKASTETQQKHKESLERLSEQQQDLRAAILELEGLMQGN